MRHGEERGEAIISIKSNTCDAVSDNQELEDDAHSKGHRSSKQQRERFTHIKKRKLGRKIRQREGKGELKNRQTRTSHMKMELK